MSFLFAAPEALAAAASDLAGVGSTLGTATAAAAAPTSAVAASAADGVSAQVAAFLSEHGLGYQQFSAQIAKFHEQFVQTLSAGANAFAAAESNAAQTLARAVNAPASALLGGGGGGVAGAAGDAVSSAVSRVESVVAGSNFLGGAGLLGGGGGVQAVASQAGALLLQPTAGIRALTAASALLAPAAAVTNAAAVPAANALVSIGDQIEAAYLAIEPWVQYGFNLAAYAVGWLPYIGWLAPQINFFYYLFEPIVQSALFNAIDVIDGTIGFTQGLSTFWSATTASINQFVNTEINWVLDFLPPLPPLPPIGVNLP
ncbi:MAG: hypothetical protein JWP83_968 [Mycobacterium sp.]|jgi:hypothetical protein|uniref:PE family protein n=1 Tax=Mycobacterium sp. TaxID=1785 RepID=UPI00260F15D1|nr:PE family protein [Mycobacterium sp.]MCW2659816.1 hypothetical protein [Mycobacterium sp.]